MPCASLPALELSGRPRAANTPGGCQSAVSYTHLDVYKRQGTTRVDLRLDLETNDYPNYSVTLKSIRTDKVLWHSGKLKAVMNGQTGALSASVPAKLLKQELYQVELTGTPPHGDAELVSTYVFRILIK